MYVHLRWRGAALVAAAAAVVAALVSSPATAVPSEPQVPAPILAPLQVSGTSVTISWTDQSTDEENFVVYRRSGNDGLFGSIRDVLTTTQGGTGAVYSIVDTIPAGTQQCYAVTTFISFGRAGEEFSAEQCTQAWPRNPTPAAGPGGFATLNQGGASNGLEPAGVVGSDGLAVFAFQSAPQPGSPIDTGQVFISYCRDAGCTSSGFVWPDWILSGPPAIAVGGNGFPVVAYIGKETCDVPGHGSADPECREHVVLRLIVCESANCVSRSRQSIGLSWSRTVRGGVALTVGPDGFPLVAYLSRVPGSSSRAEVKVLHCLADDCVNHSRTSTVDTISFDAGTDLAMAMAPSGRAVLAYHDAGPYGDLKVATCLDAHCVASRKVTVDSTGISGLRPSIAVGRDGLPIIVHERRDAPGDANGKVVVSHCVNAFCSATTNTVLDTTGAVAAAPSVAIGADTFPVIAYSHSSGPSLRVARCENLACTASTRSTVEANGTTGAMNPTVVIGGDGRPMVGYFDEALKGLRVVDCGNALCRPPFTS